MVTNYLTSEQLRRQQFLSISRSSRRSRARTIVSIRRRHQLYFIDEGQTNLNTEISMPLIIENDTYLPIDEEYPNLRENVGVCVADEEMENEIIQTEGSHNIERIIYNVGDVAKVRKECLSILRVFPNAHNLKHPATLALMYGDCTLNSLGYMNHECHLCGARLWKSEGISTPHGCVGKYCCSHGKVSLLPLMGPPPALRDLLHGDDNKSKMFRKNIRAYNSSLAFVSLGAQIDEQFSRGGGVYTFRIHGTTYHRIGTLLPDGTQRDTEHELQNRLERVPTLDAQVMESL